MNDNQRKPRVLVTTVGSWSSRVGDDSMSSLMQKYGAENVACLYIRADKSDSKSASRYFHIMEGRVMKSIFNRGITTGEEFRPEDIDIDEKSEEQSAEMSRYSSFKKHRWGVFLFARELVWKLGCWKSKELKAFLDDFKPEVLVCPIESYIHFNSINEYIIRRCNPKVIGFLWDDNFTYKQEPFNFWHQLHRVWLRKSVHRIAEKCCEIFCLSPKMKEECDKEFGVDSLLLTKPIFNQGMFKPYEICKPVKMLYTGNLFVGRDKTIKMIADALREINKDGVKVVLDIYTKSEITPNTRKRIEIDGICCIHRSIPQNEVFKLQEEADILLFAESLERKKNQGARLSFSTKITDYFRAGRCIWAVGSPTLGPIDYLQRMDAAIMSTDEKSILSSLKLIIDNPRIIKEYAEKGYNCGIKYHNGDVVLSKLYMMIQSLCYDYESITNTD